MSNILALDASTKSTGFAFKINGELHSGVITSASTVIEKRIAHMRDEIIKIVQENNIDIVVIEEVHAEYTHNSSVNQKLNWLQGVIRVGLWECNPKIKVITILPNSWRAKIGIHTGRGITRDILKQKDIEYVATKYDKRVNDDEADAIGILDAYLINPELLTAAKPKSKGKIGTDKSAF